MDAKQLAQQCNDDGVFAMAARCWTGSLSLDVDDGLTLVIEDGRVTPVADPEPDPDRAGAVVLRAPTEVWDALLAAVPPPQCSDLASARYRGLRIEGNEETFWQHYGAIVRVVELLRRDAHGRSPSEGPRPLGDGPTFDTPIGRYLAVDLDGHPHRLYVETAGHGIPVLLQHTAGAHGSQWRHLFEDRWLTERFQLIAYDLPFHGKSLPPSSREWWSETYQLTTERLMAVPLAVADAMALVDPLFIGCSIGGLLALDLARHHPDRFRAVIGVEPALKVEGKLAAMQNLWHPRVDSGYKATLMEGLVAPQSPEAFKKETAFVYAQGWPPAFLGDIYFYVEDHDLRAEAAEIDTSQVEVHLLSGAYDWSATPDAGREAHEAIAGSTWQLMEDVGHFPMSENPSRFLEYLRPVLEGVLERADAR
jgi:pimeloyl-ACP methyl ester carboxylesterase